jgi:hypothetical protein
MNTLKNADHKFLQSSRPLIPGKVTTLVPIKKPFDNLTNNFIKK